MFFRFPADARWNPERSVVEFGQRLAAWQHEAAVRLKITAMPTATRSVLSRRLALAI
jgi:hypothetical protein